MANNTLAKALGGTIAQSETVILSLDLTACKRSFSKEHHHCRGWASFAAKTEPKNVSRHDTHPMITGNESAATPDHILRTTGPAFNSTIIAQVR